MAATIRLSQQHSCSLDGLADEVIEQSGGNYHAFAGLNNDQAESRHRVVDRSAGVTTPGSAAENLPASLHDMRGPGRSRSNRRTGRDRTRIETGGQVSRHRSLLPSFLGRRSFAPPLSKGMIEYDHRDQILAFLLPSSQSRWKFIEGPNAFCGFSDPAVVPRKRT